MNKIELLGKLYELLDNDLYRRNLGEEIEALIKKLEAPQGEREALINLYKGVNNG